MVGYLGSGSRASCLTEGLTLAGPGFLLLLLNPGVLAVAQKQPGRVPVKAIVIKVGLLSCARVE